MTYLKLNKSRLINLEYALKREVLRTNRAGSYSNTTIIDCNTRKYHGLLVAPLEQFDGDKHVLLSSVDETVIQHNKQFNLGLRKYEGNNYEPKGHKYIREFHSDPIPRLVYRVGGVILSKERVFVRNSPQILIKYTLIKAKSPTTIRLKPFLAFRNIHALSKANMHANTHFNEIDNGIATRLYANYPDLNMQLSKKANYIPAPDWYYNVEYLEEQKRGYDYKEDLFVPGYFEFNLKQGESIVFSAGLENDKPTQLKTKFTRETKYRTPRSDIRSCIENTSYQFFTYLGNKPMVVAGYPWLPVRLRDMFIALPGLTLPQKDYKIFEQSMGAALQYLDGFLFPETINKSHIKHHPIDIPLWYLWSLQQYSFRNKDADIWKKYGSSIKKILNGYFNKNNHILAENKLLKSNQAKQSNTWMNAYVDDHPVYSRNGFAIETNALWYNALNFTKQLIENKKESKLQALIHNTLPELKTAFQEVFYNKENNTWFDCVDDNTNYNQLRPNQVIAAGLPFSPMSKDQIRNVVDQCKQQLLTPYGLRTLSPLDENYKAKYRGDHNTREFAAINGSVWPWLFTHYFEAKHKLQPKSTLGQARRFLINFESELEIDGLCCISELYHGNPTQRAKGAISYAMNTGELLRLNYLLDKLE